MSFDDSRAQWWIDHVKHTREYVNGIFNKKPPVTIEAAKGLWHGVLEWEKIAGSDLASFLMGEHTVLAKTLADSAERGFKPNEFAYLAAYLMKNAVAQANLYYATVPNFPKDEFLKLLTAHIEATGAYIAAAKNDMKTFKESYQKVLDNMRALANFSLRAFPPTKSNLKQLEGGDDDDDEGVDGGGSMSEGGGDKTCF
jgi:hypothetical protein